MTRGRRHDRATRTACAALALVAALAGSAAAGQLMLSGSATAQRRIIEPAQQELEKRTGVKIDFTAAGTIRGIKDLMAGSAGAALSDCPLALAFQEAGAPTEGTFQEHVISQDQVVAIVNPRNTVKKLTGAQLAAIHSGKITNWKDVGGPDDRIVVVIPPQSSGTRSVIQDSLLSGGAFVANAYVTVTDREALDIIAKSPIAIAMLSEGFVSRQARDVKVVSAQPIKRQLSVVTKNEPGEDLRKVIKFLQSKDAKKLFR